MGKDRIASREKQLLVLRHCLELGKPVHLDYTGGEDWLSYDAVASVIGLEATTVKKNVSKKNIPTHPTRAGFVRLSVYQNAVYGEG